MYLSGKKGVSYFNFQKRPITQRFDQFGDAPKFADVEAVADQFITHFIAGEVDSVHVAYMNFISAGVQKPEVLTLLPLAGVAKAAMAGREAQADGDLRFLSRCAVAAG